jgi:hypothetical protein
VPDEKLPDNADYRTALHDRIESDLHSHPLIHETTHLKMDDATDLFLKLAHWMVDNVPTGRELSVALTKLEEASMWARAGISRNQ